MGAGEAGLVRSVVAWLEGEARGRPAEMRAASHTGLSSLDQATSLKEPQAGGRPVPLAETKAKGSQLGGIPCPLTAS